MEELIIRKLGPIEYMKLSVKNFMIFTGAQASGKSTAAKSIFFFKNIKNILLTQIRKKYLLERELNISLKNRLIREIRANFLQIFGTTWCMDREMSMKYKYFDELSIEVFLKEDPRKPNYIWVDFSEMLSQKLEELDKNIKSEDLNDLDVLRKKIDDIFKDEYEVIYIPAGRSMITLLSSQWNYIYSSMDDSQKRSIDYCTQSYLENILKLKLSFNIPLEMMVDNIIKTTNRKINKELLYQAIKLMKNVLKGEYITAEGEERLQISKERYIKINFASSGQQEVVWILNTLFYYLLNNKKAYFIIEEPESNLFPNAQKLVIEFIALIKNKGNKILITTHSPYVLGTVNNLLYADKISKEKSVLKHEIEKIISANIWIDFCNFAAYFLENGKSEECIDKEINGIKNEVIDGASEDINIDFDKMVALEDDAL